MSKRNWDDLVNKSYTISSGSVLTVKELDKSNVNRIELIFECDICSRDEDLWPYGSITSSVYEIEKGQIPCGCSKSPRWDERQYKVIVKRLCEIKDYTFLGWSEKFTNINTKLLLKNNKTGHIWDSTSIGKFKMGRGDPKERIKKLNESVMVSDEDFVDDVYKRNNYPEGSTFVRSNNNRSKIIVTCSKCSKDEYVQEGLCSGIFEVPKSDITKGSLACRCSAHPMWTEKQYIYKINKMGIGHFNQWVSEFKDRTSHFKWTCNHGHSNKSSIYNFLNNESGCTTCCRRGFKKDIPAILYVVRWYGFGESFLKFGITNRDVFERINEQRSRGMLDYELVKVYYSDLGEIVDNCERELKKMMNTHQCPKRWLPDGFTETVEDTEDNLKSIHDTTILFNLKEITND